MKRAGDDWKGEGKGILLAVRSKNTCIDVFSFNGPRPQIPVQVVPPSPYCGGRELRLLK